MTHELSHGQKSVGRGAVRDHLLREPAQRAPLHLRVLEPAEHVLKALEVLDRLANLGVVEHRREHLQRVAQLLAPLPQHVQVFRRGGVGDRGATLDDPPVRPRATLARARAPADHAAPCAGARRVGQRGQLPRPVVEQPPQPGPAQRAQQGPTIGRPPAREVRLERLEVGGRGGHQPAGHLGQAELVHVEVADRGGEVAEPLELRLPRLPDVRRQRRPAELEQRAGPPDRYPDVVEELGVNVGDRAREVVAHLLEEFGQLGGEQRTRRRLGVGHRGARGPGRDRLVHGGLEQGRDQPPRAVGLLLIAAQRPDGDHGRRRGAAVGGLVDVEAHDDLAVRVAQLGPVHQPSTLVDDE